MVITKIECYSTGVDGIYESEGRKFSFTSTIIGEGFNKKLNLHIFSDKDVSTYTIQNPNECPGRIGQLARRIVMELHNNNKMKVRN